MKTSSDHATLAAETPDDEQPQRPAPEPSLAPEVQAQLGSLLRGMYGELLTRPIPDRLLDLLDRLDEGAGETRR